MHLFNQVYVAVEIMQEMPGRMIYGANYVVRSYREVEQVLAFKEILNDRRSPR